MLKENQAYILDNKKDEHVYYLGNDDNSHYFISKTEGPEYISASYILISDGSHFYDEKTNQ